MKHRVWKRNEVIATIRDRIWTYLSPSATAEELALDAAALLQFEESDVFRLGRVHFLLSQEVSHLLETMPVLVRRLATTSAHEAEESFERIRGAIDWPATLGAQRAAGMSHLYVTRPARRAFQTVENELLLFVLDSIVELAQELGWNRTTRLGAPIADHFDEAERWRRHRSLSQVERRAPTSRAVARVRCGRLRRRYESVIDAYDAYLNLVAHLDRPALRAAIEQQALVVASDPILFEILVTFIVIDVLKDLGWRVSPLRVFSGALHLTANRAPEERIELWYQHVPSELSKHSRYEAIQRRHSFPSVGALRPDLVLRLSTEDRCRYLLVEAKLGKVRKVRESARAAIQDLLAYRRCFETTLSDHAYPYGLGVAWGADLSPVPAEIMVATPDHIADAMRVFADSA